VDGRKNGASFAKGTAYGVEVAGNATFTNAQDASIYLGRDASDPSKDVTIQLVSLTIHNPGNGSFAG